MRAWLLRYAAPVLILAGVTAYVFWPAPPAWTIFRISAVEQGRMTWAMDGLESREECDRAAGQLARTAEEGGVAGYVCGYGCRFLGSRPNARYCDEMGEPHEPV